MLLQLDAKIRKGPYIDFWQNLKNLILGKLKTFKTNFPHKNNFS